MVKLDPFLHNLGRSELLETIYQLGRILSERRSVGAAEGELSVGEAVGKQSKVHLAVMRALRNIERDAGAPLEKISNEVRSSYSHELDSLLSERVLKSSSQFSAMEIESALANLRENLDLQSID